MNYKLPDMNYSFNVSIVGKETSIPWNGKFTYKRPTISERGQIEAMACRLNNDLISIDSDVMAIHRALSHLRFTLKEFPDWWRDSDFGGALYDTNVIIEIYKKVIDFEDSWREKVLSGKPEDVEDETDRPNVGTSGSLTI